MKILEKNNVYDVKFTYDRLDEFYTINCYAENGKQSLGQLTFKVTGKYSNKIFAYKIETTSELGKGVGSALIDAIEYFALVNNIENFDAKYYPTNQYARDFYKHRGYEIYKEGYESGVFKMYDKDKITKNVLPKIIEVSRSDEKNISVEKY